MGKLHAAVCRQLVEDHLHPSGPGARVGHDKDIIGAGREVHTRQLEDMNLSACNSEAFAQPLKKRGNPHQGSGNDMVEEPRGWRAAALETVHRKSAGLALGENCRAPVAVGLQKTAPGGQVEEFRQFITRERLAEPRGKRRAELRGILPAVESFQEKLFFAAEAEGLATAAIADQIVSALSGEPRNQFQSADGKWSLRFGNGCVHLSVTLYPTEICIPFHA